MSRSNAILLFLLATWMSPALSADPPPGTTAPVPIGVPDIDPATGLSRSTVVRPLREVAPANPANPATPVQATPRPVREPVATLPHIAIILPTVSPALGTLAESVLEGFQAGAAAAGKEAPSVIASAVDNEGPALLEACREAQLRGAFLVVAGLTRDGASGLAKSECARAPLLLLNDPLANLAIGKPGFEPSPADLPSTVFHVSLSIEQEARNAALMAVGDGLHAAIVITSSSPLARRAQEAFEREWTRAAGEIRRIPYSGIPDSATQVRERLANARGDMVFLALEEADARAVRPYVSGMLPIYATSLSVNPRGDPVVNLDLQGVRYGEMPWFVQPDHPAVMVYPPRPNVSVDRERLYAFGIDAFRLATLIARGEAARPLDGVTGRITLEPGRNFARALVASEVDSGRVVPMHPAQ
jgi:outer membrane PBP1 activator LpoA protein